jgi:hypothetical protein
MRSACWVGVQFAHAILWLCVGGAYALVLLAGWFCHRIAPRANFRCGVIHVDRLGRGVEEDKQRP